MLVGTIGSLPIVTVDGDRSSKYPKQSEFTETGTPFFNSTVVQDGRIVPEGMNYISFEKARTITKGVVRCGDIVMTTRGSIGKIALVPQCYDGAIINAQMLIIRSGSPEIDPLFLFHLLRSPKLQSQFISFSSGSAQPQIPIRDLKSIPVAFPPAPRQKRIAEILSAHDDLIEVNTRRIKALEEMARRTYEEWFGKNAITSIDSIPGPERAKWWALEDLASEIRDNVDPALAQSGTRYLGLEHLPRRSLTLTQWGDPESTISSKLAFAPGDVLFGKIRPYFHKVGYASFGGITSSDTIVIRPRAPAFSALVTMAAFSDAFVDYAVQTSNGTKMPRASWGVLKRYGLLKVEDDVLTEFSQTVRPQLDLAAALAAQNTNLRAQRDLLLPRLISGEIDVAEAIRPQAMAAE